MTPRKLYDQELTWLCDSLEEMSNMVEASLNNLSFAIEHKNDGLAQQIIRDDANVNNLERSIESQCLALITRQQPIASDLRLVSAILKVVTDVERIGDHASDIAELILRLNHAELETYSIHFQPMIAAARQMVHDAVSAFINRDKELANAVIASDDVVDDLFNQVKHDIAERIRKNEGCPTADAADILKTDASIAAVSDRHDAGPTDVDACIDALMIAKYLERIGDHATNICEWEIFKETGAIQDTRIL